MAHAQRLLAFLVLLFIIDNTDGENCHGHIKDKSWHELRSASRSMPTDLKLNLSMEGQSLQLNLLKDADMDSAIPFFIVSDDAKGGTQTSQFIPDLNVTLYKDLTNHAMVEVVHERLENGTICTQLDSFITRGNRLIELTSKQFLDEDMQLGAHSQENDFISDVDIDFTVMSFNISPEIDHLLTYPSGKPSVWSSPPGDFKRDASRDVYVEVLAMVDYKIYSRYQGSNKSEVFNQIYRYFFNVFSEVNMIYGAISNFPYKIHISLIRIMVSVTNGWAETCKHPYIPDTLVADACLDFTHVYISSDAQPPLPSHDHIVLLTGHKLLAEGDNSDLLGLAFYNRICSVGLSVSLANDLGDYRCIHTLAHELGHSFGSKHDGDGNVCNGYSGYIMAGDGSKIREENFANAWTFSSCSLTAMRFSLERKLDKQPERDCLTKKLKDDAFSTNISAEPNVMLGQLYNADEQCRLAHGPTSRACRDIEGFVASGISNVCVYLFCMLNKKTCRKHTALHGTTCGHKRWCVRGVCTYDPSAPAVTDNCPLGDIPGNYARYKNCSEARKIYPPYCEQEGFRSDCCSLCASLYTGVPNCTYGDRSFACHKDLCTNENNRRICCQTCSDDWAPHTVTPMPPPKPTNSSTQIVPTTSTGRPVNRNEKPIGSQKHFGKTKAEAARGPVQVDLLLLVPLGVGLSSIVL